MEVRRSIELPVDVERAWRALTDDDELAAWLGAPAGLDARPGGAGVVHDDDGIVRLVEVEAVEPGRRLVLRWWPVAADEDDEDEAAPASRVAFELTATPEGTTCLTVVETALASPSHEAPDAWAAGRAAHWEDRLARAALRLGAAALV